MGQTHGVTDNKDTWQRETGATEPITDHDSKTVMLRAERHDEISVTEVIDRIRQGGDIPSTTTVVRRTNPYFGPKLLLHAETTNYLLTAPGPNTQLLLWGPQRTNSGNRKGWSTIAEVTATLVDDQSQYDLCSECGDPIQTLEHERRAAVNRCPGPEI
jgi:hypothetical protein